MWLYNVEIWWFPLISSVLWIQGSRDDLSTNGGFHSQSAMKHANSVDTSFSKDVLNSIAGTWHLPRTLVFNPHPCLPCTSSCFSPTPQSITHYLYGTVYYIYIAKVSFYIFLGMPSSSFLFYLAFIFTWLRCYQIASFWKQYLSFHCT